MQYPSLHSVAKHWEPLISQAVNPDADICVERADELLGPGWRQTLGDMRTTTRTNAAKKKLRDIVVQRLKENLETIGISVTKPSTRIYVFAAALCKDTAVVKALQRYFEQQAKEEMGIRTRNGKFDPEALAALLSLPARVQANERLWRVVYKEGIGHSLRHQLKPFTRLGVFLSICFSIADGDVKIGAEEYGSEEDGMRRDYTGFKLGSSFVSATTVSTFVGARTRQGLEDEATKWFPVFESVLGEGFFDSINRSGTAFKAALRDLAAADKSLLNNSNLAPATGGPPTLSTSCTEVPITMRFLKDYVSVDFPTSSNNYFQVERIVASSRVGWPRAARAAVAERLSYSFGFC